MSYQYIFETKVVSFSMVQLGLSCVAYSCLVLPGVANLVQLGLPSVAYSCLVLPGVANFCQFLPSVANFCQLLPSVSKCCQVLPIVAEYCLIFKTFDKGGWGPSGGLLVDSLGSKDPHR